MPTDTLYEKDFVVWTERQAEALRAAASAGSNLPIDWDRVAEEIEDLGNEVLHKVESLTHQTLTHLLKLACSSAVDPRNGWKSDVDTFRYQLERQLRSNHAVRARFDEIVTGELGRAFKTVQRNFVRYGEADGVPRLLAWKVRGVTASEVLEDGLYPIPGTLDMERDPE